MAIYYDPDQPDMPVLSALDPDSVGVFSFDVSEWVNDIGAVQLDEAAWSVTPGFMLGDGATPVTKKAMTVQPLPPIIDGSSVRASIWSDAATPTNSWCTANVQIRSGNQIMDVSARFQLRNR